MMRMGCYNDHGARASFPPSLSAHHRLAAGRPPHRAPSFTENRMEHSLQVEYRSPDAERAQ